MTAPVVEVNGLSVELLGSGAEIVDEVMIRIAPGEVLGLVGESGSGKTTVGTVLLGHTRRGGRVAGGAVTIAGHDIARLRPAELRRLRGGTISYIPQDPGTALNPALRISTQLEESIEAHLPEWGAEQRARRIQEALEEVALPTDRAFLRRYPHQLSGGQQQRIAIAMAFLCRPRVIVCDEPTTGLDVTTQARVLETIRDLCRSHGVAALYVSHDLAVIAELADHVAVMYAGRIVEVGPVRQVFSAPLHPYTRRLLRAVPHVGGQQQLIGIPGRAPLPGHRPEGCSFTPRCSLATDACRLSFPPVTNMGGGHEVRCYHATDADLPRAGIVRVLAPRVLENLISVKDLHAAHGQTRVLHGIDLDVRIHECMALVGESGSGKTTLARCIAGLHRDFHGDLRMNGDTLPGPARKRSVEARQRIQYVFQNPYASLNPRRTAGQTIARQLNLFFGTRGAEADRRVAALLERVALSPRTATLYPDQLSGGERQRVAIARALAAEPALLICDEVTSALDVSVQAAIIELLGQLQNETGLSLLFITHNLALARTIADRAAVMSEGRIVERGEVDALFEAPQAEYTCRLLASTPTIEAALRAPPASTN